MRRRTKFDARVPEMRSIPRTPIPSRLPFDCENTHAVSVVFRLRERDQSVSPTRRHAALTSLSETGHSLE